MFSYMKKNSQAADMFGLDMESLSVSPETCAEYVCVLLGEGCQLIFVDEVVKVNPKTEYAFGVEQFPFKMRIRQGV